MAGRLLVLVFVKSGTQIKKLVLYWYCILIQGADSFDGAYRAPDSKQSEKSVDRRMDRPWFRAMRIVDKFDKESQ